MIRQYWSKMNERDQMALSIGGTVLLVILFYSLMYSPLLNAVKEERATLIEQHETLLWMESVQSSSQERSVKKKTIGSNKLLGIINQQLNQPDLRPFPFQLQQINKTDIQLSFDRVPFTVFIHWLWELSEQYQITIQQLSLEKLNKPGIIKASLVLQSVN